MVSSCIVNSASSEIECCYGYDCYPIAALNKNHEQRVSGTLQILVYLARAMIGINSSDVVLIIAPLLRTAFSLYRKEPFHSPKEEGIDLELGRCKRCSIWITFNLKLQVI